MNDHDIHKMLAESNTLKKRWKKKWKEEPEQEVLKLIEEVKPMLKEFQSKPDELNKFTECVEGVIKRDDIYYSKSSQLYSLLVSVVSLVVAAIALGISDDEIDRIIIILVLVICIIVLGLFFYYCIYLLKTRERFYYEMLLTLLKEEQK